MEDRPKRTRRVAEAVERGVEGLYDFLFRLLGTLWLVSWRASACRILVEDRHSDRQDYVLPFTYAAVGIFLVSLVAGVAGYQILDWIWFYEEIPERIVDRLREGVSLVAMAVGSVPAFIFMLGLSAALAATLERRWGRSGRAMFVTCYAIGTQCFYLFAAALTVSLGQLLRPGSGLLAEAIGLAVAGLLVAFLAGALLLPARFLARSFAGRNGRRSRRIAKLFAYLLISGASMWALPLIAGSPGLLAAALKPSDEPKLTIESGPALYLEAGEPRLAVDVLVENRGTGTFGAASTDARATIRYGREPLESDRAETLALGALRVENEAGEPVRYTAASQDKFVWRRLVFAPSEQDIEVLARLAKGSPASCIQVRFGGGESELQSVCVRASIADQRATESSASKA